jgi:hypothetical protein
MIQGNKMKKKNSFEREAHSTVADGVLHPRFNLCSTVGERLQTLERIAGKQGEKSTTKRDLIVTRNNEQKTVNNMAQIRMKKHSSVEAKSRSAALAPKMIEAAVSRV